MYNKSSIYHFTSAVKIYSGGNYIGHRYYTIFLKEAPFDFMCIYANLSKV